MGLIIKTIKCKKVAVDKKYTYLNKRLENMFKIIFIQSYIFCFCTVADPTMIAGPSIICQQ